MRMVPKRTDRHRIFETEQFRPEQQSGKQVSYASHL